MQLTSETSVVIPRKVWTRAESQKLVELGFPNAEKLELIEGDLITLISKGHLHMLWQTLLHEWLVTVFGWSFVRSGGSTQIDELSEPEPDLMVTNCSIRDFSAPPVPADLKLVVEISDSTLQLDLKVKANLYARAGIVEYWVVDVRDRKLLVHRVPTETGYSDVKSYAADEEVAPLAAPDAKLTLNRL